MEELAALRRSKYVQSRVGLSYRQVKQDLKDGKTVLFLGNPLPECGPEKVSWKDRYGEADPGRYRLSRRSLPERVQRVSEGTLPERTI